MRLNFSGAIGQFRDWKEVAYIHFQPIGRAVFPTPFRHFLILPGNRHYPEFGRPTLT